MVKVEGLAQAGQSGLGASSVEKVPRHRGGRVTSAWDCQPELGLERKKEPDIHPGQFWLQDVVAGRTRGSCWSGFDPQAWVEE